MKKAMRLLTLALTLIMVLGLGTTVFADGSDGPTVEVTPSGSCSGPAPPITKVEYFDHGFLDNGNLYVAVKRYGYGNMFTRFDGNSLPKPFRSDPFIISGGCVDGFTEWFDCGPNPGPGTYDFVARWLPMGGGLKTVTIPIIIN